MASFGGKTGCLEEAKKKLRETEKDGFKWQPGYDTGFKEDKDGILLTVQYVCFPDTEDPREKKGKGKNNRILGPIISKRRVRNVHLSLPMLRPCPL